MRANAHRLRQGAPPKGSVAQRHPRHQSHEAQSKEEEMSTKPHIRIVTLNVQTLGKRMPLRIHTLRNYCVDIACIQEARVTTVSFPTVQKTFEKAGYQAHLSSQWIDDMGRITGGCLTLSRLPMAQLTDPETTHSHRCVLPSIQIPGREPMTLANVHGIPASKTATSQLVHACLNRVKMTGRQFAIVGDFNLMPSEGVIAEITARGWAHLPETPEEQLEPTRPGGRHVDYMVCDRHLRVTRRTQETVAGMADHDMIYYDIPCGTTPSQFMFKTRPAITKSERVTEESFHEAFRKHETAFHEAETRCDADSMWTITSNLAEQLLTEGSKGHARSKEPKIVECPDTGRDTDLGTVALRKLHKLHNKAHVAKQHPDQEKVLKRLRTLQEDLARSLPVVGELNVMTTEGTRQLEQIINERVNNEQQRRLGR